MSRRNQGFSLAEFVIGLSIIGILIVVAYPFFNTTLRQFFVLEQEGLMFSQLSMQSQRLAKVLRGATDITQATNTEVTVYAYFAPNDTYVSLIHYYKNAAGTKLLADITPMTANPPTGTLLTAQQRTVTIIENFYSAAGVNTFEYLDAAGNTLAMPISDLHTIKGARVNLAVPITLPSQSGNDTITIQVSMRNRKTNL
ncbi:MAG TPA: prepilin-type N-terminal cleavage/methylation domain-containing protein [Candidatus Saccharimonadales bacterium]|nr:prepilin-type N-terminal cleavage/methylation domain-containing protein [Candidatus Saccharimonadales bacterium]